MADALSRRRLDDAVSKADTAVIVSDRRCSFFAIFVRCLFVFGCGFRYGVSTALFAFDANSDANGVTIASAAILSAVALMILIYGAVIFCEYRATIALLLAVGCRTCDMVCDYIHLVGFVLLSFSVQWSLRYLVLLVL